MERRIEQLLNGKFEYEPGSLLREPESLELETSAGSTLSGTFTLTGGEGQRIHGYLYPSSARMRVDPAEFRGIENEIRYQFDCSGLKEGAESRGSIAVCSDCGEFEIPYCVKIEAPRGEEALPVSDLEAFAALAKEDAQKAYGLFLKPGFEGLLRDRPELQSLYDGLRAAGDDPRNMEEFLTGAGLKDRLVFTVDSGDAEEADGLLLDYGEVLKPVRETVRLRKNTWGYQELFIESDALFVRPEKKEISTDQFAGSTYDLNLILDSNLMHAGNNYARITIRGGRENVTFAVTAKGAVKTGPGAGMRSDKAAVKKLVDLYIDFRLQKMDLSSWAENSTLAVNSYKRSGGKDVLADLFLAQVSYADGKEQKAQQFLESVEVRSGELNTEERYCYYLYVSTFVYQEESYVDRVEAEISARLTGSPSSWPLQWMLFYLKEDYLDNGSARYEAVKEQFALGCRNRIMYLEALLALKKEPLLLRQLGGFEIHLLSFADQEGEITDGILSQAVSLTMHVREYDERLIRVLENGYTRRPSEEVIGAICHLLLKGEKLDPEYFKWYELGIEAGLKMNGLYEAYMQTISMEDLCYRELPQTVRMYFGYDTTLDYGRRAALYRSIYEDRKNDTQTWYNYRPAIERFVTDQLELGHLTGDLMVLYRSFLRETTLTDSGAEKLIRLLFTYEVTCPDPDIRQIVVHSARAPKENPVSLIDGKAMVRIYDPDSTVFLLDKTGVRYEPSSLCQVTRVFEPADNERNSAQASSGNYPDSLDRMLAWCAKKAPEYPGLVIFLCAQSRDSGMMNANLLPYFRTGCEWDGFSDEFRSELRRAVLAYYMDHPRDDTLPAFLDEISYRDYARADKTAMITILAEESRCTEAFDLLDVYGAEDIPLMQLVRICSRMVLELEFEENTMLVSLCRGCFESGKFDDKLLRYLLLYDEGPVEEMKQVWHSACEFGLDTMMIEERILTMMLFTREGTEGSEPIFESYLGKMGRMKLIRAYVNLKCYEYFVKGIPVAESVFSFVEDEYAKFSEEGTLDEQEEVCRLALLQHYARAISLNDNQKKYAARMLDELNSKDLRFAFYERLDPDLIRPYQLEGHVFAEYVCNPKHSVKIRYRITDSSGREEVPLTEEDVPNRFEGIFVHEFTLFEGEEVECCFIENDGKGEHLSDVWHLQPMKESSDTGRYSTLNRLLQAARDGSDEKIKEELDTYLTSEYLADKVFTLI